MSNVEVDKYCMDLVKQHDFDNYLVGLLVPSQHRSAFFAIRAFNVEIATIKDQANNNVMAGRIRFQYWRDILDDIYSGKDFSSSTAMNQPVVYALYKHINELNLTSRWFQRSIEARQSDLSVDRYETLDEIEDYTEKAHSSMLYLILESMNIKDENVEYIASHVGVSYGIMILLRGFAYHSSKGSIYIPRDIMAKCNVKPDIVLRGPRNEQEQGKLNNAIFEVASQAFGHLDMARKLNAKGIPKNSIYSLLPAIRSSMYLEDLRKVDFNPVHPTLLEPSTHLNYQLAILRASWFKSF